jgi:ABC-type tungstate transport system permease subunit
MARTGTYTSALRRSLAALEAGPVDAAVVRLATGYAKALDDDSGLLDQLGPKLLATLTALGMTPAARAMATGKGVGSGSTGTGPLDELRARRAARQHHAASVDA